MAGGSKAQCETLSVCLASISIFHLDPERSQSSQDTHDWYLLDCMLTLSVCQSAFPQNVFAVRSPEVLPHAHLPIFLDDEEEEEKVLVWTVVLLLLLLPSVEKGVR